MTSQPSDPANLVNVVDYYHSSVALTAVIGDFADVDFGGLPVFFVESMESILLSIRDRGELDAVAIKKRFARHRGQRSLCVD